MNLNDLMLRKQKYKKGTNLNLIFDEKEMDFILDEIIKLNQSGISFTQIARDLHMCRTRIREYMNKKKYNIINQQNKLRVRKDLFKVIETEEDAYWLGFIYADGYISEKGKFEISLNYKDYEHLLKFADYCHFDRNKVVKKQKIGKYYRCRISFATQELFTNFTNVGIISNKSLVLKYPEFLKESLHPHFIRGYFDGDGSINLRKPRSKNTKIREITASLLGTEDFLRYVNLNAPVGNKNIRKINNIYCLSFSCREAYLFLGFLYNNSTIHLNRKFNNFKNNIAPIYSDIYSGFL